MIQEEAKIATFTEKYDILVTNYEEQPQNSNQMVTTIVTTNLKPMSW